MPRPSIDSRVVVVFAPAAAALVAALVFGEVGFILCSAFGLAYSFVGLRLSPGGSPSDTWPMHLLMAGALLVSLPAILVF